MILIAQPKSASSSLVKTIAKVSNGFGHVGIKPEDKPVFLDEYTELGKLHTTLCLRPKKKIVNWAIDRTNIWKEHFLPDDPAMKSVPFVAVVLLRKIEDTIDSYRRLAEKHNLDIDFYVLENELAEYQRKWLDMARENSRLMVVWYSDLIKDYDYTMVKILKHYKLRIPEKIPELEKVFYTGVGEKRIKPKRKRRKKANDN